MNETKDPQYQINFGPTPQTYEDGFADGYSRAWQECWEYFRTMTSDDKKEAGE